MALKYCEFLISSESDKFLFVKEITINFKMQEIYVLRKEE
jgi:hypothetical protein